MLLRAGGFYASAAGLVPGAMPAWAAVGTLLSSLTLPGSHSVNVPSHTSGDLLLLRVMLRNSEADGAMTVDTAGWTPAPGNPYGSTGQLARNAFAWKIGNGSETSVSITATGGTTNDRIHAKVHRFTAANGFAASPVQGIVSTDSAANVSSINMPTVTASALRQLAVALVAQSSNVTIAEATGETGGDWTEPTAEDATSQGVSGIQTAGLSGGGSISGGSISFGGTGHAIVTAFTLVPAQVAA